MIIENILLFIISVSLPMVTITNMVDQENVIVPQRFGQVSLFVENNEFKIKDSSGVHRIQRAFMDKELRGISSENLSKLIHAGSYISVNKSETNNDYSLKLNRRLNGGGPIGFAIGYYSVKVLGYGIPAALASAGIVSTIPVVATAGLSAGAAAGAGATLTYVTSTLTGAAIAAGTGTAAVATGAATAIAVPTVIATVGAAAATEGVIAATVAVGGPAAYVAGVETAAVAAGTLAAFLPF